MITAVIAVVALLQGGQGAKSSPGDLISRMLARYFNAKTAVGKITLTQTANDKELHGQTEVAFQRPSQIFVRQTVQGDNSVSRIVSDGSRFLYSIPQESLAGASANADQVLVEEVVQWNPNEMKNMPLDLGQIYTVGKVGLILRPEPLDVAIGYRPDLKVFSSQLATLSDEGVKTVNGKQGHVIAGDWRQYADAPVSGKYQLVITNDGELVRYVRKETVAGPPGTAPIDVITIWDVDLKLNGKVDQSYFKFTK